MSELRAPLKDLLRTTTTSASVTRMWHRIEARDRTRRDRPRARNAILVAAAMLVASTALAFVWSGGRAASRGNAEQIATANAASPVRPVAGNATLATTQPLAAPVAASAPSTAATPSPAIEPAAEAHVAVAPRALPAARAASASTPPRETWQNLAARGDHSRAYAELGHDGFASAAASASVEDLFALADVARLSGHPIDAVQPLERIVQDHASDARAPLAALTLGRIQLRSLGNAPAAAGALGKAIALGVPRGVAEDAYGLLVEARARAGDAAGAREAYAEYQSRFPDGAQRSALEGWLRDR